MSAYYNENDAFAAAWLRELIKAGAIAEGEVDERSIEDVLPSDLRGFTQYHFFAGIAGWSLALRLAGWSDQRPVVTGSCPCQPFSAAGKRTGTADERHLWPAFYHLVRELRPRTIFGEQVASKDGLAWFGTVQADLAAAGYAVAAADLCAAGFGAPHIRQRLYFVADSQQHQRRQELPNLRGCVERSPTEGMEQRSVYVGSRNVADNNTRLEGRQLLSERSDELFAGPSGLVGELAESNKQQRNGSRQARTAGRDESSNGSGLEHAPSEQEGIPRCTWFDGRPADWIECQDGKTRPVEPGTFPLAHGIPNRVGRLRGYGNAIVPQVAAEFIKAYLDIHS